LHPTGTDDLAYVGWQTASREEFEATKAKLLTGGVEYDQGTPGEIANRRVIDMVRCEVSNVPMEVFYGPQIIFERPFRPSTPITGFRTGDLGLGHVGLAPDDDAELIGVLMECLDFRVSDSMRGTERFFHCNPREHTAVVAGTPGGKRIGHFMIELNSLNDVGACMDLCEDKGVKIVRGLGRHTNDHMTSFYMKNPSDFSIEYGWGGRLIDDQTWQAMRVRRGEHVGPPAAEQGPRRVQQVDLPSAGNGPKPTGLLHK